MPGDPRDTVAMRTRLLCLVAALGLSACAAPWPAAIPPDPGAVGAGPVCGPQQYPFQSLQDFEHGHALVRADVGPDGRLVNPVLEQGPFSSYLRAGAIAAVQQCSLAQARAGSQVRLLVAFDFYGGNEYLPNGVVTVMFAPVPAR